MMSFNPMNLTFYHGLLGVILHFGFWFALSYYLNNREYFKLEKLIPVFLIVSVLQILFATIQYSLPTDHFFNSYVAETKYVATVGDAVRVTGTFSYIGGFGSFMVFYSFLITVLIKTEYSKKILLFLIVLGFLGCFMNGSRSVTIFYSVCIVLSISKNFLLIILQDSIKLIPILGIILILGIGESVIDLFKKSSGNFVERVEDTRDSGEQNRRVFGALNDVLDFKGNYQVFGRGLGGTYQGSNAIWGQSPFITEYGGYEEEPERIILEGGFFLLFIKLLLWLFFIIESKIRKGFLVIIISIIFLYFVYTFNIFNAIYILIGIMLLDRVSFVSENNNNSE